MAPAHKTQKSGNSAAVPTEVSPRVGSPSSGRWDLRSSGAGAFGDPVAALLARAHRARMEVRRIEAEMRACRCQHEVALEHCTAAVVGDGLWWRELTDRDGKRYRREDQHGKMLEDWQPCWKGKLVPSGNPYPLPPME